MLEKRDTFQKEKKKRLVKYARDRPISILTARQFSRLGWSMHHCQLPHAGVKFRKSELCDQYIFQRQYSPIVTTPAVARMPEVCRQHCTMQLSLDNGYLDDNLLCWPHLATALHGAQFKLRSVSSAAYELASLVLQTYIGFGRDYITSRNDPSSELMRGFTTSVKQKPLLNMTKYSNTRRTE